LPSPEIALPTAHFNTKLYTGDGATTLAVSGVGFSPGLLWIKNRDADDNHIVVDALRGATKYIVPNDYTVAETTDATFVASLDSDGFTVGDDVVVNTNAENYVSWNWYCPTTFDPTTDGDISVATGLSNSTAGFSIVRWVGESSGTSSSDSNTIGHGLSQAPELIIAKELVANTGSLSGWPVGGSHGFNTAWEYFLLLQSTNAESNTNGTDVWNDTTPSSSVFTVGDGGMTNESGNPYIGYCFHSVEGYSKVGSYTGNDSTDGVFLYCGFRPALIMVKRTDTSGTGWVLMDAARNTYNVMNDSLLANSSAAENDARATMPLDFVSNGFKWRTNYSDVNGASGGTNHTYIYLAFAESPFKTSNAR